MSYIRFGLMIATSTLVMFVLMYLNTYAWEHVFFSETRAYMAVLMGASMAVVMLAFMLGMYTDRRLNAAIFAGSILVFAGSLWLVRSQATVSGISYMRAMIPHHSIAIMTSGRAQIRDPRVRKLADEIIEAQRREIAEMRYLVAALAEDRRVETVYHDPPAEVGSVADALGRVLRSTLDLAPMVAAEADQILADPDRCAFRRSRGSPPVLWTAAGGQEAAAKLNGVLLALDPQGEGTFSAEGLTLSVRPLGDDADWRADAELIFALTDGPTVGYRGFWTCAGE
jgi:hypothetical protein